jgi:hypothetical protein
MSYLGVGSGRFQSGKTGWVASAVVALLALLPARDARAQGEIAGKVMVADSGRPSLPGAEASIAKLRLTTVSDSSGRFRFRSVPAGAHVVVLRAIGFKSESSTVTIDYDEVVSWDVVLTRAVGTTLPERVVTASGASPAPAKLAEFTERQKLGVGHFIDRKQLAKAEGGMRMTGDIISQVPGVRVRRGQNKVWIASARTTRSGKCAFCAASSGDIEKADWAAGARPACYMDVYLDGALVQDARHPEYGLFNANTISPEHVGGIEVYSSAAQIPAKYNRTGSNCGVVLIWTR